MTNLNMNKIITALAFALALSSVQLNAIKIPFIVVKAATKDAKKLVKSTDQGTATAVSYGAFGLGLASHVVDIACYVQDIPVHKGDLSVAKKIFFGIAAAAQGIYWFKEITV